MEDQLISFETAKLAKEKGFDWKVRFSYGKKEEVSKESLNGYEDDNFNFYKGTYWQISAPTQSLLQKWLREKHNIHITIDLLNNSFEEFGFTISYPWREYINNINEDLKKPYEEALEEALVESLKLINK